MRFLGENKWTLLIVLPVVATASIVLVFQVWLRNSSSRRIFGHLPRMIWLQPAEHGPLRWARAGARLRFRPVRVVDRRGKNGPEAFTRIKERRDLTWLNGLNWCAELGMLFSWGVPVAMVLGLLCGKSSLRPYRGSLPGLGLVLLVPFTFQDARDAGTPSVGGSLYRRKFWRGHIGHFDQYPGFSCGHCDPPRWLSR